MLPILDYSSLTSQDRQREGGRERERERERVQQFVIFRLHFKTVYLNTLDKQGFYSHLGYTPCGPVVSLGANASRVSQQFVSTIVNTMTGR